MAFNSKSVSCSESDDSDFRYELNEGEASEEDEESEENEDVEEVESDDSDVSVNERVNANAKVIKSEVEKKKKFSSEAIKHLLDCYADMITKFDNPGMEKKNLWNDIAKSLGKNFGCVLTGKECSQRFRSLQSHYHKVRDVNKRSGVKPVNLTIRNGLMNILLKRDAVILKLFSMKG